MAWRRSSAATLAVTIAVTAAYAVFVLWRLRLMGYDPSFFVVAGPLATDPSGVLPNLHVYPPGITYDGQFFYRLALQPWTSDQTAYGITLDLPAYRQQRILYPLLAWVLSGANWQSTPVALIGANLLCVGVLAYCAARFSVAVGRSAFASVLVPMYPGYLVTISRDLAELTEAAALMLGLVLVQRRHYVAASVALIAAMLAKETMLIVPVAGCVVWAARRARGSMVSWSELLTWLAPLLAYAVWTGLLWLRWRTSPLAQGSGNFGRPFAALSQHLQTLSAWRANAVEIALLGLVSLTAVLVIAAYGRRLFDTALPLACVVYALLAFFYSSFVWIDDHSYFRVLHELFFTGALALLARTMWITRALSIVTCGLWVLFALQSGPAP